MASSCTIKFFNENSDKPFTCVSHYIDGKPNMVGLDLAIWLKDIEIIDGIGRERIEDGYANGMGCLAAQYIAKVKNEVGNVYIRDVEHIERHNYEVHIKYGRIRIKYNDFYGKPDQYIEKFK